jgi:hypothetical protein
MDSDIGGDPAQEKANRKRKREVEELGRPFFTTRKREIENYLSTDMLYEQSGVVVEFNDTDDAKTIIGNAVGMKPDDVSDRFWPYMSADRILDVSSYQDGEQNKHELVEIITGILKIVDNGLH